MHTRKVAFPCYFFSNLIKQSKQSHENEVSNNLALIYQITSGLSDSQQSIFNNFRQNATAKPNKGRGGLGGQQLEGALIRGNMVTWYLLNRNRLSSGSLINFYESSRFFSSLRQQILRFISLKKHNFCNKPKFTANTGIN